MKRDIELLAPGGDLDSIKAAIAAGADAVYCGLNKFNARNRAENLNFEALSGVINLAHKNSCKVFLTLNIVVAGSEIPALTRLLNRLVNTGIDAVIVQDFGLFYLLSKYFKTIEVHASTQLNTHNQGQIHFLKKLAANRVNLARELSIDEIRALTLTGHENGISTEVFVHGSYCISFSGLCYMSSVHGGNSGNRGRCSQPCRDRYRTTPEGNNFPLNLKDNSAYFDLEELSEAGVDSLKIEGRIKGFDYVHAVVNCWKKKIRNFLENNGPANDNGDLYRVFNRDFTNSYLRGDIDGTMFIDSPRDNSIKQLAETTNYSSPESMEESHETYYKEKAELSALARHGISRLSIAKTPLTVSLSGKKDAPLTVSVTTPDTSFTVRSQTNLSHVAQASRGLNGRDQNGEAGEGANENGGPAPPRRNGGDKSLNRDVFFNKLKALDDTAFYIKHMDSEGLRDGLFISFKELTAIKKKILSTLTGSKDFFNPIDPPRVIKQPQLTGKPTLSLLISSREDLHLGKGVSGDLFFQLPERLKPELSGFTELFLEHGETTPWFPPVLIGEDYTAAVEFLARVRPERIVTNNTGIAHEAFKRKIPWIAGPFLNITNSFSLLCLKEKFDCYGSFISNELNRKQIKSIIRPENFELYYSIYHPISLMTSRQCLHRQVVGCGKTGIDKGCIQKCGKTASIENQGGTSLFVNKAKGSHHRIHNDENFLNTDIVADLPGVFTSFLIDLRDIRTETRVAVDKAGITSLFGKFLNGAPGFDRKLKQAIQPSTNTQYAKGI